MHPFPHRYEGTLVWEGDSRGALSSGPRPVLAGGPPAEFDGDPAHWSPEHLLLAAVNLCLMTTYLALNRKADVGLRSWRSRIDGLLDKTREGLAFTRITVAVQLEAERPDDARRLLETAKKHCIVSNALKCPVEVSVG